MPLTQNYRNYGGPQFQYAPQDLVPYSRYNYGTGTTLSGNVPSYDAWIRQNPGNIGTGDADPHDAYEIAMTMGLMTPQQFNANIDRNRPQSGGFLDTLAGGIIGAAGLPGGTSFVDRALGSSQAPQYANTQGSNPLAALLPLLLAGGLLGNQQPQKRGILGNVSPDEGMGGPIAQTNLQRIAMTGG